MSPGIQVRPVEPGDLNALLALCREHAAYEKADFVENGQAGRWHAALFSGEPALYGWMATDGEEYCGFMTVTIDFATWSAEPFAYMDCLYLRETYRGRGIGRVFLDRLREFAAARQCGWAEWQTPPYNELGIGFYRRMGATAKPKVRFHYDTEERGAS
jgi:ribosomal protein S18 acetylase RimI-like enzyme